MKKIFLLVVAVTFTFSSQAQLGGLMNKAKNATEQKAKEKAEKEKKEAEQKAKEATNSNSGNTTQSNNSNSNNSSGSTVSSNEKKEDTQKENTNSNASSNSNSTSPNSTKPVNNSALTQEDPAIVRFKKGNSNDEGMTSETHKAYVGKIVFSKSHIEKGKENSADFQNSFSGTDVIYGRYYASASFFNLPVFVHNGPAPTRNIYGSFFIDIFIDGKNARDYPEIFNKGVPPHYYEESDVYLSTTYMTPEVKESKKIATTNELLINPIGSEAINPQWAIIANTIPPGEHTIKFDVWGGSDAYPGNTTKGIVASGEFKYTKKQGDYISFGKDYKAIDKPKPGAFVLDAPTKTKMIQAIESHEEGKVLKLIIEDDAWLIEKHELTGVIKERGIWTWYILKNKNGYCVVGRSRVTQSYAGGSYGQMFTTGGLSADASSYQYVDCSTVK